MLNITPNERDLLNASGALTEDDFGEEILAGLTVGESQFVLDSEKFGADQLPNQLRERFLTLRIQHRRARVLLSAVRLKLVLPTKPRSDEIGRAHV